MDTNTIKKQWDKGDEHESNEAEKLGKEIGRQWASLVTRPSIIRRLARNLEERSELYQTFRELEQDEPTVSCDMAEYDDARARWEGDEYLEPAFIGGFVEGAIDLHDEISKAAA